MDFYITETLYIIKYHINTHKNTLVTFFLKEITKGGVSYRFNFGLFIS